MISDVLSYEQPQSYIVEDTEYTNEGTPVLTANKAFVLGYTSEIDGIYDKGDCILFDDFTLDCKYVDFSFKVKSSAIKILTAENKELLRYTFEFLKYLDLSTDEHKRHYITETQNIGFILPTKQIVRTISNVFSALSLQMETIVKQKNALEKQKQYLLRQMFIWTSDEASIASAIQGLLRASVLSTIYFLLQTITLHIEVVLCMMDRIFWLFRSLWNIYEV